MMPEKILIVEDNECNGMLLRDILTFHGYDVSIADNGRKGVHMAAEIKPGLILMDIQMPVMDGMSALKELRSNPLTSQLIVIAVTSFAMRGDQEKILRAGFDGYLSKPISTRELPQTIQRYLSGNQNP